MDIAQLAARRSHNPKVVSSILTIHIAIGLYLTRRCGTLPANGHQLCCVPSNVDSLGFEPRAPRKLSGCDTTTPRALKTFQGNLTSDAISS